MKTKLLKSILLTLALVFTQISCGEGDGDSSGGGPGLIDVQPRSAQEGDTLTITADSGCDAAANCRVFLGKQELLKQSYLPVITEKFLSVSGFGTEGTIEATSESMADQSTHYAITATVPTGILALCPATNLTSTGACQLSVALVDKDARVSNFITIAISKKIAEPIITPACTSNLQCSGSETCVAGKCTKSPAPSGDGDSDGDGDGDGDGDECSINYTCTKKYGAGYFCEGGECVENEDDGSCKIDTECGINQECYKGECVMQGTEECEKTCNTSTHICIDNHVSIVCSELVEFDAECESNDECGGNLECHPKYLTCVQYCKAASECAAGFNCHAEGFCVHQWCTVDSECSGGFMCHADGYCVANMAN